MNHLLFSLALIALAAPVAAQNSQWEFGASNEHLTRGYAPWRSVYLNAHTRLAPDWTFNGGLREVERYGLKDDEIHAGLSAPLACCAHLQFEWGHSTSHHVLPEDYVQFGIEGELAKAWVAAAGWRRSDFDAGMTNVGHLTIERYLGNHRIGYTLYEGKPDGASFSTSHKLHWAWHYDRGDERNRLGASAVNGHETENTGAGGFLTTSVESLQFSGLHWFDRGWAIDWEVGRTRQGDIYTRRGFRLGLRHAF
jgi:YaiO family outer membrane protein